jgi:hypothetical protein
LQTATTSDTAEVGSGRNTFVVYKNTGTQKTVTVTVPGNTIYGKPMPPQALTLAATTGELWIPMRKEYDSGTGRATITLDSATAVTVAVVRAAWAG